MKTHMIDFRKLREQIAINDVLAIIEWKPALGSGSRGPCPVHGSTGPRSRSFSVDRRGGRFQCFKCGAKGNALDLYAQVVRLPIYVAATELCRRMGLDVPWRT